METTTASEQIISAAELLKHWQGHRSLTRRVIEAFPEKELFEFSIGGMRPFAKIVKELLAITGPGMEEIATGITGEYRDDLPDLTTKEHLLRKWDETTEIIDRYWPQLPAERFRETVNLFGHYNFPVIVNIQYIVDNEIHHRGQGYVYLRALGIEPPAFWER